MSDPHVVSLRYRVEFAPTVTFDNAPALEYESDKFRMRLENGIAVFELKEHFSSVDVARGIVDAFVRAWELDVALKSGQREITFVYENAEVIDRNPPPPGEPKVIQTSGMVQSQSMGFLNLSVARHEYPSPPRDFAINPDVETLWRRFEGYTQGREPLPAMAYFCLTVLEKKAGTRKKAEKAYRIDYDVLDKLGELTSTKGDKETARKTNDAKTFAPLTKTETMWIEATLKAIIRRVGEIDTNPSASMITMNDLPKLQ